MIGETRITLKNIGSLVGTRWMPASIESNFPGIVHTKWGKFPSLKYAERNYGKLGAYFWQLPDRQIRVSYAELPDWGDEKVDLTVHGKNSVFQTDFAMLNTFKSEISQAKAQQAKAGNYLTVGDSGGFQMVSGVTEFVNPKQIAIKARALTDIQICLDIPPGPIVDRKILTCGAHVLAMNNKLFERMRGPKSFFMNVSHGSSVSLRKMWLDIVLNEGPPMDGLAVGGLQSTFADGGMWKIDPHEFVKHAMFVLNYTDYHYYHFLGVSSDWQIIVLQVLAHRYKKLITVDSASHIMMSNYGFLKTLGRADKIGRLDKQVWDLNPIPCSCPFCTPYRYKQVFKKKSNTMQGHNTEMTSVIPFYYGTMLETMGLKSFSDHMSHMLAPKVGQAIIAAANGSWKSISQTDETSKYLRAAHGPPSLIQKVGEIEMSTIAKRTKRYLEIAQRYYDFHKVKR